MLNLTDSMYLMAGAFDMFPDAIVVVNKQGIIKNANKQIESVFGYTIKDVIDQELTMLLPDRFRSGHGNFIAAYFKNPSLRKMGTGMSLSGKHQSGKIIDIDVALTMIQAGSEPYALAVIRDISDKMQLVQSLSNIEKIKDELEQFAYVISHDLKAPLNRVKMLAQLINLELGERESNDMRTIVTYLNDSVDGMERLIYGVLEYHRAKIQKSDKDDVLDLNNIYKEATHLISIPPAFKINVLSHLPKVQGNQSQLIQIFLNLISNAINHNTRSEGLLEISWQQQPGFVELSFADNGVPIPDVYREKIFEMATQLKTNKNLRQGHGLGLAIVRQIIENKNCKVWYEPSHLGGSAFKFTWPAGA